MAELKDRIKQLRNEKGITQDDLATYLGVSRSTVAGYETAKRKPEYETLQKIASYFKVSVDYLLGNTNERHPADKLLNEKDLEIQELLDRFNVHLDGEILTKEDKNSVINFLRMLRDRDKMKKE
ncbi:helix-turn-helix domain-containing protein [Halocella sp. SP3-1]|uniref:helix-turn-helix domain-containing protein n=1 Tax=Halocella sp. SP3-1 TaxID=2382161 RepID=UPI000F7615FD|nr:helix-turn-helix domain-containing protein [Halocella sp. SP3-1]AZO95240.1 helix-turn-helix domain-containing protein [Halocella sp. SP3-1]